MSMKLNPYLALPGTAREAMERYQSVLGGELLIHTFGDTGMEGPGADGVMHASLQTETGFTLMASDLPPGMEMAPSLGTISLSGDDDAELRGYWEGLSAGSVVVMPLERQMWGDVFGQCVDAFGVSWMVNITDVED